MDDTPSTPPEQTPAQSSLFGRLFNIFAAPGEVYAEVKTSPPCTANWLTPVLVFVLASWLGFALMYSQESVRQQLADIRNQAIEKQMAKAKAPPAQVEQAQQMAEKFGTIGTIVSTVVGAAVVGFVSPFWWGLILWLVGAKVFKVTIITKWDIISQEGAGNACLIAVQRRKISEAQIVLGL